MLGERAVDYLMKYVASSDQTTALTTAGSLRSVVKKHQNYMQKYKTKLENAEKKATTPQLKDIIHDIVLVLEGKRYNNFCVYDVSGSFCIIRF